MKPHTVIEHAQAGDVHAVKAELHVLVSPSDDGHGFVAQGLEIDYVATGSTEKEARDHFAAGFVQTIHAMFKRGRDLGALFTKSQTPPETKARYYAAARQDILRCTSVHDLSDSLADLPKSAPVPRSVRFATAH